MLTRGNTGEAVKKLQRDLNRLGSMLKVDGDYGSSTEAAVADARAMLKLPHSLDADDPLLQKLAALPEPSVELTAPGVTFIGREEVSSPAEYRRKYIHPVWPSATSGITIGIGYDLRFANAAKLQADWRELLPAGVITRLAQVSGTVGSPARLESVRDIIVPLPAAVRAFLDRMMPEHIGNTRRAFASLDNLPPHRRTALISLVFNRGGSLNPNDDRRREMRTIRDLLAAGKLDSVAEQFEFMTRLWPTEPGLVDRRRREARLWREGFAGLQLE
jgi:hypothetical protein